LKTLVSIGVIRSRTVRWAGHVTRIVEVKFSVGNPEEGVKLKLEDNIKI
jgi:hypothetical protein